MAIVTWYCVTRDSTSVVAVPIKGIIGLYLSSLLFRSVTKRRIYTRDAFFTTLLGTQCRPHVIKIRRATAATARLYQLTSDRTTNHFTFQSFKRDKGEIYNHTVTQRGHHVIIQAGCLTFQRVQNKMRVPVCKRCPINY